MMDQLASHVITRDLILGACAYEPVTVYHSSLDQSGYVIHISNDTMRIMRERGLEKVTLTPLNNDEVKSTNLAENLRELEIYQSSAEFPPVQPYAICIL
jgi:hypothetical protein